MAKWFGKEVVELPDEYKDLTPEQVVERLRNADAATAKVTDLEGRVSAAEADRQKIADLERKLNEATQRQQQQNQPQNNGQQPQNERTSFLVDEDRAFGERIAPLAQMTFGMGAEMARNSFVGSINDPIERRMYEKWRPELDEYMGGVQDLSVKMQPRNWADAWAIIKGRHAQDIMKAARENTDFFSEVSSGNPNGGPVRTEDPNVLTDEEKKLAKNYGIDEKDYLANRKEMVIHHG